MALTRGFTQNSATTPLDTRLMFMGLLARKTDGSPRVGMLYGPTSPITGTTSMNVTLADNTAFATSRGTTDGVNLILNVGGPVTVTLDAAPTANSRIDVVWVKQNDGGTGGQSDADSNPVFGKTSGQAVAVPATPSIPVGALALASIRVPANAASTTDSGVVISTLVQPTILAGGVDDSGWQSLPSQSGGYSAKPQTFVQYKLRGGVVILRGQLNRNNNSNITVNDVMATFPAGLRVNQAMAFRAVGASGAELVVAVNPDGTLGFNRVNGSSNYVILDGISWPVDQ